MKRAHMRIRARAVLLAIATPFFISGCSDSTAKPAVEAGLLEYVGDFECLNIDGDASILLYDPDLGTGWFGWIPSNGGLDTYVLHRIDGLSFSVTFHDVYGADHSGETETLTFDFVGGLSQNGKAVLGEGTVTRVSGVESCTFRFSRP